MMDKVLKRFFDENRIAGSKGALCVGLVISREAREKGLPLSFDSLLTENRGQIRILGKSPVQKILGEHGIDRVLAVKHGTSRLGGKGHCFTCLICGQKRNLWLEQGKWFVEAYCSVPESRAS